MFRPHQRFPNQKRLIPSCPQLRDIFSRLNPTLRYAHNFIWKELRQAERGRHIHFKRPQIARIHTD
jgi:hypothetical protein